MENLETVELTLVDEKTIYNTCFFSSTLRNCSSNHWKKKMNFDYKIKGRKLEFRITEGSPLQNSCNKYLLKEDI